ncbi:MAG: hypothetical protein Kilf2KO_34830 [Rhodospirillales bacterium]
MSAAAKPTPALDGPSVARDLQPEARLSSETSASSGFESARTGATATQNDRSQEAETASGGADGNAEGRRRFADIKAQCQYCSRSLECDVSL